MNIVFDKTLKLLRRKVYPLFFRQDGLPELSYESDEATCQAMLLELLNSGKPCMVSRLGSVELMAVVNYLGVKHNPHSPLKYIRGEITQWWWNRKSIADMQTNAGFFPLTEENICRFAELMLADIQQIDILGSWLKEEHYLSLYLARARRVKLSHLEPPYLSADATVPSWTTSLEGKRVLVVHPFAKTICSQYARREQLFCRSDILPAFSLSVLQAVQSIGGHSTFSSWFDALQWMKDSMDSTPYDISIIGCGAYGLPLAAHAKRTGHQAIHLGGASQLLFGIRGRRWDDIPRYQPLFNDYWVRPGADETPAASMNVEGGCYW